MGLSLQNRSIALWFSDRNINGKQHRITYLIKVTAFNQLIKKQKNFFSFLPTFSLFPLPLSHTTHTHPVSGSLDLRNTLHYLSRDALHASLGSVRAFEVTRSSDHLTYFIKNTWDATQTGSLFPSRLKAQTRLIHQAPTWAGLATFHSSFPLRAFPAFISSCA